MAEVRVGTSGWHYPHWRSRFYPEQLRPSDWLPYFAERFSTVEVNATFYREPRRSTLAAWVEQTPDDFLFAIKMHRAITHYQRLENVEESLQRFEEVAGAFGQKLGIVLIQLPPSLTFDRERDEAFFKRLRSKNKMRRYALEARHKSWLTEEAYELLRRYDVAWCIADSGGRYPTAEQVTAPYIYLRFHGPGPLYASSYSDEVLQQWAKKIRRWKREKCDVYVYFNNDFEGYAPLNARRLIELVG